MKNFLKEFKEFAMRGNVVDMAIGVVIGGAFSKIVSALVENIITPLLSIILGRINITGLAFRIDEAGITLAYGAFLQTIIDFICIAFSIFLFIKLMNKFQKKKVEEPEPEPVLSKEEKLLTEIRDLLKEQNSQKSNH
ncbi:MAG: large-conductance mechanosensitive channel protein MscL [Eubacterium sp.]